VANHTFQDKNAIVTGASDGIGRATALALARQGAHIVLAGRRQNILEQVASEIHRLNQKTLVVSTDVTDQAQVDKLVGTTIEQWGRIDILISNAGEYIRAPVESLTKDDIQRSLAVNFYGGVYCILATLPHMRRQGGGHIVVVTSMDGKKGIPPDAPYAAAKYALTGFLDVVRQELHGTGVYISNVLPGRVDTKMIETLRFSWVSAKISSDQVASATLKAIEKRKPIVILPVQAMLLYYLDVISPRLGDWLARSLRLEGWE
jgi:NAD(P)-dependent dehydrogenase (short-subunit alcohol dehydrogenase family)